MAPLVGSPWADPLVTVGVFCEAGSSLRDRSVAWLRATVTSQGLALGRDPVTQ